MSGRRGCLPFAVHSSFVAYILLCSCRGGVNMAGLSTTRICRVWRRHMALSVWGLLSCTRNICVAPSLLSWHGIGDITPACSYIASVFALRCTHLSRISLYSIFRMTFCYLSFAKAFSPYLALGFDRYLAFRIRFLYFCASSRVLSFFLHYTAAAYKRAACFLL